MKAIVIDRYGSPDVMELREVPTPRPGPGEVLVRVRAASVNDWDLGILRGTPYLTRLGGGLRRPKVRIAGCDLAGEVEAAGEGVDGLAPGDRVYGDLCMAGFGTFAEHVVAPPSALARIPGGMSFEQAAAIPQAGMLAVQGLIDAGRLRSGQRVLLNGAGGGVGTIALQLCRLHDVEVTAVDRAGKLDLLRSLGADRVLDYRQTDFTRERERYDLILDVKTTRSPLAYAWALEPGGVYATVGGATWRLLQVLALGRPIAWLAKKQVRLVMLKPNKDLGYLGELFAAGKLAPVIDRVYDLADAAEAMRRFASGEHLGKVVIAVP